MPGPSIQQQFVLKPTQQQRQDPRLFHAMEILQLSTEDLNKRVEQEIAANPALEWKGTTAEHSSNFANQQVRKHAGSHDDKTDALMSVPARSASMYDQLVEQWHLAEEAPHLRRIGEQLIALINPDGYLTASDEECLSTLTDTASLEQVQQMRQRLQRTLEPVGLGARDLHECLLLQIDHQIGQNPNPDLLVVREILENHLDDLLQHRHTDIANTLGIEPEEVSAAMERISQLHPHPGRLMDTQVARTIMPDAIIEPTEDEQGWEIQLTRGQLPPIQIAADMLTMARNKKLDKDTRDFARIQTAAARRLMDAIQLRANTLQKVVSEITQQQDAFLRRGTSHMQPLTMHDLAGHIGLHVATVSRAVAGKYVQCPQGTLPLRHFFSAGFTSDDGQSLSAQAIMVRIEQWIKQEDPKRPLSDQKLSQLFKDQGFDIARRTIAKYREQQGIPSTRQRRK